METIEIKGDGNAYVLLKCDGWDFSVFRAFDTFGEAWDAMYKDWQKCHDPEDPDEDEGECNPGATFAWLNRAREDRDVDWEIVKITIKGA